jgi:16S rRNA (adenine1518-N6/adenine1519-N6)-dimethyltransferase
MEKFVHKKSLGQNFLKSEKAFRDIIDSAQIKKDEWILEIGPGLGALTEKLLGSGARVVAIEKDKNLIDILNKKFEQETKEGRFFLIEQDALLFNISVSPIQNNEYKLVANIPYYITGEILRLALSVWRQPKKIVLMLQKEVAKRICATDKRESLLSISVKIFGEPKIISTVKAGSFVPAPKVDSAILEIDHLSKEKLAGLEEKIFFLIVKAGFAHKRKMLGGNLKTILQEKTEEILKKR